MKLVLREGFEPSSPKALPPQSSVYTVPPSEQTLPKGLIAKGFRLHDSTPASSALRFFSKSMCSKRLQDGIRTHIRNVHDNSLVADKQDNVKLDNVPYR